MATPLPSTPSGYNNIFTEIVARHLFNNEIGMENLTVHRLGPIVHRIDSGLYPAKEPDLESYLMELAETAVRNFLTIPLVTVPLSVAQRWDSIIENTQDAVLRDIMQTAVDYIDWMQIGKEVVGHIRDQQKTQKEKDANA